MHRQDPKAAAKQLLAHLDHRTTAMADAIYRNPVTDGRVTPGHPAASS